MILSESTPFVFIKNDKWQLDLLMGVVELLVNWDYRPRNKLPHLYWQKYIYIIKLFLRDF